MKIIKYLKYLYCKCPAVYVKPIHTGIRILILYRTVPTSKVTKATKTFYPGRYTVYSGLSPIQIVIEVI